ncbi:hypothetical protein BEP19_00990 [Ammoniphilus oxalaticus]|uniref:histidine kinase n=1 Tax=Ammoniphilus oxalaticus TaxID=66863 RepID=A0A419SMM8_9BACL|nr:hypothetical protein BEP19_00990 [Ammoniphilus oxalaticus]
MPAELKAVELPQGIRSVKEGEQFHISETKRIDRNGDVIYVSVTTFPLYNLHQKFDGWAVIFRDITEWKKSQEMLQQSEKLSVAGQLAAGIAHEIRNPITSVKGFLQLMQTGYGEKEEYMEIMTSEIDRIEIILGELLILAKPQITKYEQANAQKLLEHVVALLGTQGNLHNISISTDFEVEHPYIDCDENQIKQVFINFIKNSMEAMPQGGEISIELQRIEERMLRICFIDQGCGIPEEILEKIGQPFFTTKENGTGLGFMISKKIIEDHGGSMTLKSKVDEGTVIEVFLPTEPVNEAHLTTGKR